MSGMTKILIVLLSLSSIFLCGTVVIYVVSADNYKAKYKEQEKLYNSVKSENARLVAQYNKQSEEMTRLSNDLKLQIQQLGESENKLQIELRNAERKSSGFEARLASMTGVLTGFKQTIEALRQSLEKTQAQLDQSRQESITDRQYLKQIEANLYERIVQMQALESEKRRILEEKVSLEEQMTEYIGPGTIDGRSGVVTQVLDPARAAIEIPATVDLKGLVTNVGESLVTISIGSADGVKKGMVFHVTRGDVFIRDIIITDVDTNKAAGTLDLGREIPRIGDNVSTNL